MAAKCSRDAVVMVLRWLSGDGCSVSWLVMNGNGWSNKHHAASDGYSYGWWYWMRTNPGKQPLLFEVELNRSY